MHGEGFSSIGNRKWCHPLMVQLARKGSLTVAVGYRVARAAPYPAQIEDCRTAIRWPRANGAKYGVDPDRIGCLGGPAGAVLTALVAWMDKSAGMDSCEFPDLSSCVQAAVCLSGSYDARLETYERVNADSHVRGAHPGGMALLFEPDAAKRRQLAKQLGVGRADTSAESALAAADWNALKAHPDWARGFSAVMHLTPDDPPLLIFHSENDPLDIRHARELEQALHAVGRRDPVIVVPGSDHGEWLYLRHPDVKEKVHAFLAEHLGSRTNPSRDQE